MRRSWETNVEVSPKGSMNTRAPSPTRRKAECPYHSIRIYPLLSVRVPPRPIKPRWIFSSVGASRPLGEGDRAEHTRIGPQRRRDDVVADRSAELLGLEVAAQKLGHLPAHRAEHPLPVLAAEHDLAATSDPRRRDRARRRARSRRRGSD